MEVDKRARPRHYEVNDSNSWLRTTYVIASMSARNVAHDALPRLRAGARDDGGLGAAERMEPARLEPATLLGSIRETVGGATGTRGDGRPSR